MRDVDEFLARAEDVLADWEGSDDAAVWSADGSHEHEIAPYAYLGVHGPGIDDLFAAAHSVWARIFREMFAAFDQLTAASAPPSVTFTGIWLDEAGVFRPAPKRGASLDETAARWLRSWRVGDGGGSLEPVAGCLPPFTAKRDVGPVGFVVPLVAHRLLAPTAGPATGEFRRRRAS